MPETMTERELIEAIFSDPTIRDSVTHLVCNMLEVKSARLRAEQTKAPYNARYEIAVTGRQVSSGAYMHRFVTVGSRQSVELAPA